MQDIFLSGIFQQFGLRSAMQGKSVSSFYANALCNESVQQGTSSLNKNFCSDIYAPDHET